MLKQILLSLLTILLPQQAITYTKEYLLNTESIPLNIYWISEDNILLSYLNGAEIFNLENRTRNRIEGCSNCIYGYDRELLRCEYVHREIQSIEEFSTTVYLYDFKENLIFQKDIFPTVIPAICKRDYILLKNAYPFLEKKSYVLDVNSEEIKDYIQQRKIIDVEGLPKYTNISIGKERLLLLSKENILSVYKRL